MKFNFKFNWLTQELYCCCLLFFFIYFIYLFSIYYKTRLFTKFYMLSTAKIRPMHKRIRYLELNQDVANVNNMKRFHYVVHKG